MISIRIFTVKSFSWTSMKKEIDLTIFAWEINFRCENIATHYRMAIKVCEISSKCKPLSVDGNEKSIKKEATAPLTRKTIFFFFSKPHANKRNKQHFSWIERNFKNKFSIYLGFRLPFILSLRINLREVKFSKKKSRKLQ